MAIKSSNNRPAEPHIDRPSSPLDGSAHVLHTSASGGGGGGSAATIADGGDVTQGAKADAAANNTTGSWSVVALLKSLINAALAATPVGSNIIGKVGIDQTTGQNIVKPAFSTAYVLRQGSVTAGGTAQQWAPARSRSGYSFQNVSSGDLYLLEDAASATAASATNFTVKVPAGGYYYNEPWYVSQGIISVFGATTGQAFTGKDVT